LLDVKRHGIDQVDAIAALRQPDGVSPGATADVRDHGGRFREIALEQRPGACEFECALTADEPVALESSSIERHDFVGVTACGVAP
jgi:hypothetical protein